VQAPRRSVRGLPRILIWFNVMEMRGTLETGDVLAAQWLHLRPRRSYAIVGVLLLVLCAWALWYSFSVPALSTNAWFLVGCVVFLILLFALWLPYKSIRSYRQRKNLQRETYFVASDNGLMGQNENGYMTTPWGDYLKWKEGRGGFLLYVSDELFQVIPKRFFQSESETAAFREMLRAKVGVK
jgi:YcxB-like protein